jgi:ABC-2 type transport system ATP-binding protein
MRRVPSHGTSYCIAEWASLEWRFGPDLPELGRPRCRDRVIQPLSRFPPTGRSNPAYNLLGIVAFFSIQASFVQIFGDSSMSSEVVIQTRNLTKIYRDFWGRKKVRALNSLSLEVQRGEVFGLLGPNGSGKTTTLKLLLGLLFPTEGEVTILGKSASDVTKNERIGYLPEESYLYRFLNAEETLDFYGRLFNMPASVRRERSKKLIERVGLTNARRRQLKEYSKGMTRRIGLAQALINEPDLILLDEPTSGLDPLGSRDMKDTIVKLKEEGKTVVMCSHLLADVQDVCDRIAILDGGELKVFGQVQDLLKDQGVTQIKTSRLPDGVVKEVEAVLARHGANLLEVDHPTTSLEDLFVKTVRESAARPGQRYVAPSPGKA